MKYCTKCGHQMQDNIRFCQKCGTKAAVLPRRGMKLLARLFFILAGTAGLTAILNPAGAAIVVFSGILGMMFLVLSRSPKNNPYIFGRPTGIDKRFFVILCIILAFSFASIIASQICLFTK